MAGEQLEGVVAAGAGTRPFGLTLQWLIDPAGADLEPTLARFRERVALGLRP